MDKFWDALFVFVGIGLMLVGAAHPMINGIPALIVFVVGWGMTETFYKSIVSRKTAVEYVEELRKKEAKREEKNKKKIEPMKDSGGVELVS